MGLSLLAELYAYPGPKHVLELADKLSLHNEQRSRAFELFELIKAEAMPIGAKQISEETELEPANIKLVSLPPYSPELNPVERLWLHLQSRRLSHRLHSEYDAIAEAVCQAWNRLIGEARRIKLLRSYPWTPRVET